MTELKINEVKSDSKSKAEFKVLRDSQDVALLTIGRMRISDSDGSKPRTVYEVVLRDLKTPTEPSAVAFGVKVTQAIYGNLTYGRKINRGAITGIRMNIVTLEPSGQQNEGYQIVPSTLVASDMESEYARPKGSDLSKFVIRISVDGISIIDGLPMFSTPFAGQLPFREIDRIHRRLSRKLTAELKHHLAENQATKDKLNKLTKV